MHLWAQNVCDMMKKAMRTLMDNFRPVVKDVAQLTADMYNSSPQPPMLDLAKQVSDKSDWTTSTTESVL